MATTLTAPIHADKRYKVTFQNDNQSTGVVLVVAGWVPKHQNNTPPAQVMALAPGGTSDFEGKIPPVTVVRRLSITVSLDKGEFGVLEVFEDDISHTFKIVTETTTFEMPVDP
jgi:hypothetical protein